MFRKKFYVEYPLAKNLEEAISWLENGDEIWQEDEENWPACGGWEDIEDLKDNFKDGLNESDRVHLVPSYKRTDNDRVVFKIGDKVTRIKYTEIEENNSSNLTIDEFEEVTIKNIIHEEYSIYLSFEEYPNLLFSENKFCYDLTRD